MDAKKKDKFHLYAVMLLVNAIQICSVVLETMKEPPAWEMPTLSHKPFRDPGYKLVGRNKNPLHTFGKLFVFICFFDSSQT